MTLDRPAPPKTLTIQATSRYPTLLSFNLQMNTRLE